MFASEASPVQRNRKWIDDDPSIEYGTTNALALSEHSWVRATPGRITCRTELAVEWRALARRQRDH